MSKYTKGPWRGGKECVNAPDGRLLATVHFKGISRGDTIPPEEGWANSQLMATAPELLEALASLHRAMQPFNNPNGKLMKSIQELVERAGGAV